MTLGEDLARRGKWSYFWLDTQRIKEIEKKVKQL